MIRASNRYLEGHGFDSRWGLRKFFFWVFRLENASSLFPHKCYKSSTCYESSLSSVTKVPHVTKVPFWAWQKCPINVTKVPRVTKVPHFVTKVPFFTLQKCRYLWLSLSLSLSLFRLLPAYLLPFLLFLFLIIQKTLKHVFLMYSWNLHFVFRNSIEMPRMLRIVKEISRVLSDERSK